MVKSQLADRFLVDQHQNYWQLASIQSAALGLPGMFVGGQVASVLGIGKAITSILIGNLILWTIGFAIISMAAPDRDNALENVKKYLGKIGGISAALFLILSFLSWYILQLNSAINIFDNLYNLNGNQLRWGAALGALVALLAVGGIRFIKYFNVALFPLFFIFVFYSMAYSFPIFEFKNLWGFSFAGVTMVMATTLPGIVNLPTFFRHSRSIADSYLGLTLMTIFTMVFQLYTVVVGYSGLDAVQPVGYMNNFVMIAFVLLSLVSVNLVNIYFASAAWEIVLPHRKSPKEYVIMGLLGTMAYTFFQVSAPMEFLENMASNFIASLGIALLIAFLIKIIVRHRPRFYEKVINISCWLFGGTVGTIAEVRNITDPETLSIPISATAIAFLLVIFTEEVIWSMRKIFMAKK